MSTTYNSLMLLDYVSDDDELLMLLQQEKEAAFMQLPEELTYMGALTRTYTQRSHF